MTENTQTHMTEWQEFHLGDVLTIITGLMVSPEGVGGIYKILNYMTGENLMTHQLPRAAEQCAPTLIELYPQLTTVTVPVVELESSEDKKRFWTAWLDEQVQIFGEKLPVPRLLDHTVVNPIQELVEMMESMGKEPPIVVVMDAVSAYPEQENTDGVQTVSPES